MTYFEQMMAWIRGVFKKDKKKKKKAPEPKPELPMPSNSAPPTPIAVDVPVVPAEVKDVPDADVSDTLLPPPDDPVDEFEWPPEALKFLDDERSKAALDKWSLQEIALMNTGRADYHQKHPVQFAKMVKYTDPERVPFDSHSWFRSAYFGVDTRGFKPVLIDGVEYRRGLKQAMGGDWYHIARGVVDLTADLWHYAPPHVKDAPKELKLQRMRDYKGGLREPISTWPQEYRDAYAETH